MIKNKVLCVGCMRKRNKTSFDFSLKLRCFLCRNCLKKIYNRILADKEFHQFIKDGTCVYCHLHKSLCRCLKNE